LPADQIRFAELRSLALKLPSKSRPKARSDSGTESARRRAKSSKPLELIKLTEGSPQSSAVL
jgi:hypothetical protein